MFYQADKTGDSGRCHVIERLPPVGLVKKKGSHRVKMFVFGVGQAADCRKEVEPV